MLRAKIAHSLVVKEDQFADNLNIIPLCRGRYVYPERLCQPVIENCLCERIPEFRNSSVQVYVRRGSHLRSQKRIVEVMLEDLHTDIR